MVVLCPCAVVVLACDVLGGVYSTGSVVLDMWTVLVIISVVDSCVAEVSRVLRICSDVISEALSISEAVPPVSEVLPVSEAVLAVSVVLPVSEALLPCCVTVAVSCWLVVSEVASVLICAVGGVLLHVDSQLSSDSKLLPLLSQPEKTENILHCCVSLSK